MNEVLRQLDELLFSSVEGVLVESVEVTDTVVRIEAHTTAGRAACPGCGCWSGRIHGSYLRFPRDLPAAGKFVVVSLRVRRFVCAENCCPRKTFAEQVPGLTRRFGRQTERLRSTLVSVGLALAGRAGARMTDAFQVPVSRNTLLRLIASLPDPAATTPRVVGVDEYAQRKGRIYGTVLVDVETRRPIDLLPDREADTLAAWLAERPDIEIICRDRATFFAEGATRGAPQALQVADRWHLWHNLGEAAEKCVYRHRGCLRPTPAQPEEPQEEAEGAALSPWPTGHRFAERTRAKHATIHALLAAGHSKRSVARQLGTRSCVSPVPLLRRRCSPGSGKAVQPGSTTTSHTSISAGRKAAPTPGNCGRRSRNRAIHAATPASATMSAGLFAGSPNRSAPGRHRDRMPGNRGRPQAVPTFTMCRSARSASRYYPGSITTPTPQTFNVASPPAVGDRLRS